MKHSSVVISLPIADRRTSFAFYRDALGFDAIGEAGDDGIPEPLQFALNEGLRLMLVPTVGFGWVIGDHEVAPNNNSECVMGLRAEADADVDELVARAHADGASILTVPGCQPWGYAGAFADPDGHIWMVVSTEPAGD